MLFGEMNELTAIIFYGKLKMFFSHLEVFSETEICIIAAANHCGLSVFQINPATEVRPFFNM
jgi:hypothetical protein